MQKKYVIRVQLAIKHSSQEIMKFSSIAISFAILTLTGCKNIFDKEEVAVDGSTPFTKVAAPAAENVYNASEPFKLQGNFSDKDNIKELDVNLVRLDGKTGSESVVSFQRKPDVHFYQLDTLLAPNTLAPGNYQLSFRSVDGRKNEGTTAIKFSVN
ncbi:hypothetical protein [Adhaeribacter terreus]|uniref:DUF4625 domain-containing protein n=1 Tax=Adhaeribacter terreus TaxID=529703 RepID=A0ABW0E969_9BACT